MSAHVRATTAVSPTPVLAPRPFSYARACDLAERSHEHRMLVEDLWTESAVGVIGGVPKQGKTWIALDMAVSVASGTPCLGRFAVPRPGPVLIYTAEDPEYAVRERLAGLCACRGIPLSDLAVHVIREPAIHLDRPVERARLRQTVLEVRPRAVILDPLVRVYGNVDENSAAEVSSFLAYLRALQREMDVAVVVVHHAKKAAAAHQAAGQSLRGSGDLYAWVDSLLYLRKHKGQLEVVVEHRSAPSKDPIPIALVKAPPHPPHLAVVDRTNHDEGIGSHGKAILSFLTSESQAPTTDEVRKVLGLRKERVVGLLRWLEANGKIQRDGRGWHRIGASGATVVPSSPVQTATTKS